MSRYGVKGLSSDHRLKAVDILLRARTAMLLAHHLELPDFEVVIERSAIASQRVSGAIDPTLDLLLCKWVSYFSNTDAGGQHIEGDLVLELMCCRYSGGCCVSREI